MKKYLHAFALSLIIIASVHAQTVPPVPTNVTAQGFSGEHPRIVVSWQVTAGPWYCNLYRSAGDTSHFSRINLSVGRSFEDHGVVTGRMYYYYVKSVVWNDSGLVESGRSNIASAAIGSTVRPEGTIRGTIVDDSTGVPIRFIRVRFYRQANGWSEEYDITDSFGRYEAELDTGRYLIRAESAFEQNQSPSYRPEWFDNALEPSGATVVTVGNESVFTANFGLRRYSVPRTSSINGVVQNEQGQPISGATVAIMRSMQEMHRIAATTGTIPGLGSEARTLSGIGYTRGVIWSGATDGQGRFHAVVQARGSYIAAAGKTGFLLQYFDHTGDPTQATVIVAASDTSGIDFPLRARATSPNTIQGVVRDSTGVRVPSRVILFPRPPQSRPVQVVHSDADGSYEFSHVQEGMYTVLAIPFSNYTFGFYKEGQYGVSRWQLADSVVVGNNVPGVNVGVVPIQSTGLTRASGVSFSSGGGPLVGGRVVVKNALGEVVGNGMSTASGDYCVDALPAGQVTFVVDREPYNSEQVVVTIPPNTYSLNNINVVLTRTIATAVNETGKLPLEFALEQNYPNPFNPATVIQYSLPIDSRVRLKVFDVLGREVVTLIDEEQKAGEKFLLFDARNLSSGIYYYRLNAGRFGEVKKMLLLR